MRKRLLTLLLSACMTLLGLLGLAACGEETQTPTQTQTELQKLSAPVVTLDADVASWAADEKADKFEISLDGNLSYVENTITSKKLSDGQTLKVRAVGDGTNYTTSDWSNSVTYTATGAGGENPGTGGENPGTGGENPGTGGENPGTGGENPPAQTTAPTYLGIIASKSKPSASDLPAGLKTSRMPTLYSGVRVSVQDALSGYFSEADNALGEAMPTESGYEIYSAIGNTVYIQIWLNNPDQNTILSLKLNGVKYQTGGALQSFFVEDGGSYLNCVYVAVTIPNNSYEEISYEVTEIEYVEGNNVNQDGKSVLIDEDNDTVKIGLPYQNYPSATCEEISFGCHSASVIVRVADESDLNANKGYWIRAVVLDENGVVCQEQLLPSVENEIEFTGLVEETEYTFAVFYFGDKHDGAGLTYNVMYSQTFTTNAVVTVEEFLLGGELFTDEGRNAAKITLAANLSYDAKACFDRVEIYDGETLVLTDNEFEGYTDYTTLNSKTEYTLKIYYSSAENGYTGRVKEISVTTPEYALPELETYDLEKIVVGNHAIFGFKVEKYTDLKYYDIIVRGYAQKDEYFAPFIVEMMDDSTLLERLQQQADRNYMKPNGYVWEARYYMDLYLTYLQAWEHKEYMGYEDSQWREIAESSSQYLYELTTESGDLFVANDGDFMYNYYAVLRNYFEYEETYEDLYFDIYLRVDFGDGAGVRVINIGNANPYFRGEVGDDYYGFDIEEDENVKNGYEFRETGSDYKALYVYKIALYQNGEFVCYVPFTAYDTTSVDTDAWLNEWIEKLKCEIPAATAEEMLQKLGAEIVQQIFDELWFKEDGTMDGVVEENGSVSVGGSVKGNQTERELLTVLGAFDGAALTALFEEYTGESKSLAEFIEDSPNGVIIDVITAYRNQTEVTDENASALFNAIDSVYDVYNQLKNGYEDCIREEYANKQIADPIEGIEAITFKFVAGTDLAPAGAYKLRIFCRSILKSYTGNESEEPYTRNISIKATLKAPENVRMDGRRIVWDEVEGANNYDIYVNGEKRFAAWENSYEQYGEIQDGDVIQIVAIGDFAYDSEFSEEFIYVQPKLSAPVLTVNSNRVIIQPVENATKYVYTLNGMQEETYGTVIYIYESGTLSVKAVDENGVYGDSAWTSITVEKTSPDKEK
ncbi:MAG: hypothetical protein E7380_03225 [Clostridiales bacterium]|nr:hypothetical protein [Clostridiales bacterium]